MVWNVFSPLPAFGWCGQRFPPTAVQLQLSADRAETVRGDLKGDTLSACTLCFMQGLHRPSSLAGPDRAVNHGVLCLAFNTRASLKAAVTHFNNFLKPCTDTLLRRGGTSGETKVKCDVGVVLFERCVHEPTALLLLWPGLALKLEATAWSPAVVALVASATPTWVS